MQLKKGECIYILDIVIKHFLNCWSMQLETKSDAAIKMGHGGTLDKNATGVMGILKDFQRLFVWLAEYFFLKLFGKYLVVGINDGCTDLKDFLAGSKVYHSSCVFGRATTTYNNEGQTIMEKPYGIYYL